MTARGAMPASMVTPSVSVSERLVEFLQAHRGSGLPDRVRHEARRLLLNQLKASVRAADQPVVRILNDWAVASSFAGARKAHVLWLGTETSTMHAAMVNGALFEVLDFHDTYIPTFMHAVSAVLPAVLALAEERGASGRATIDALAIGLESELAIATILMPTGYYRGFVPAGLVGGVGAAVACCALTGLDAARSRHALGLAMCTAFGLYESVGSMGLSYVTGATARSGLTAFELAERGLDAPRTGFEGERGMFACHTDEPWDKIAAVLATLGTEWRIFGQSYKTVPTETITHAPIECVLAVLARAQGRRVVRMRFGVQPIVVRIADERRERFGRQLQSELQARFDTRFCAAAAWVRGRFTLEEMHEAAYRDEQILALRDRIELVPDASFETFEGCWLEVDFTDGSQERENVDAFVGTPRNPMSDAQLGALFETTAAPVLPAGRAGRIVEAIWNLDTAQDLRGLMALARCAP